ncbi:tripartite tricarboxylate transporter TctB family protein [uncultured Jannaschia sp.]|uniref:tripartite tricarboxylate transporter TctB family protein n=1 Tax=uncultured Jannaschia sp. TaxID=293347 RepID=UPI002625285A|nr:tripartite tricarboxylate transporter TctB family protein [uncultured Jannaschia sp.]
MMRPTPYADLLTGAFALALGATGTVITLGYPSTSGGFPFALSAYMVAPIGVLLLFKGVLRLALEARPNTDGDEDSEDAQHVQFTPVTLAVIAAVTLATFAIGWLGFIISTGLLALVTGRIFRTRLWVTLVYVAAQSAVLWAFLRFFSVQMPEGLLM